MNATIFAVGMFVFLLVVAGLTLTVVEVKRIERNLRQNGTGRR